MTDQPAASVNKGALIESVSVVVALVLPEVPVIVSVAVPPVTEELADKVNVLVPVVVVGENDAVTPVGSPAIARLTFPVKPYFGMTVTVLLAVPPALMLRLFGEPSKANVGVWIESISETACVSEPDVPVTVTGTFCCATELSTERVSVSEVVTGFDAKDAVTPLGSVDVTARFTAPVNPPASVILSAVVPLPPGFKSTSLSELVSQKPGT